MDLSNRAKLNTKSRKNSVGTLVIKRWLEHRVQDVEELHNEHLKRLDLLISKPLERAKSILQIPSYQVSVKEIKAAEAQLIECSKKLFKMLTVESDDEDEAETGEDSIVAFAKEVLSKDVPYSVPTPSIEATPSESDKSLEEVSVVETVTVSVVETVTVMKTKESEEEKVECSENDCSEQAFSVKEELTKQCEVAVDKTSICSEGLYFTNDKEYVNVMVSHCVSPSSFYLQKSEECKTLLNFQTKLNACYNDTICNSEFKLNGSAILAGQLYVALYEWDMSWYRATVMDVGSDQDIEIYFVDYGNKEIISKDLLRSITPDFKIEKYFAQHCSIDSVLPIKDNTSKSWSTTCVRWFSDLVMDRNMQMKKKDVEKLNLFEDNSSKEKCHSVDLYYLDNKEAGTFINVANTMKEVKFATTVKFFNPAAPSIGGNYFTDMLKETEQDRNRAAQLAMQMETSKNAYNIYENLMKRGRAEAAFALHSQKDGKK